MYICVVVDVHEHVHFSLPHSREVAQHRASSDHCHDLSDSCIRLSPSAFSTSKVKGIFIMATQAQDLPGEASKHSRVPEFVKKLEVQQPRLGEFTVNDLPWMHAKDRGVSIMVAAFHKERLDDFVSGECRRGDTAINRGSKGDTASAGVLVNLVCRCKYAAITKMADKQKSAMPIHEHHGRRSKLVTGQTVKKVTAAFFTV
jgi:hypothetical protein